MRKSHALAATGLLALLAACASDDAVQPPAALTEFRSTADIERVWSTSLGDNRPRLRLGLGVAVEGETVFAASYSGNVDALERGTGRRLWRTDTRLKLSAGPGAGEGLVVVGATHGDIVALDAATGAEKWRSRINSELLAAPAVGNGTVLFRAVDGRLVALRATDGSQIWSAEEEVPRLSLRGTSQPLISGNLAIAGFDTGRVMALQLSDGATVWEATVAPPSGRNELDRLADVDAAVHALDDGVFVVNYQGNAVRLDRDTGAIVWSREISSYAGLTVDDTGVYVVGDDGAIVKLDPRSGLEAWRQQALARRRLSPPALLGSLLAVADLSGYVHFLDKETGELAARVRPFEERVREPPVVSGEQLFMMSANGRVASLRIKAVGETASGAIVRGGSQATGGDPNSGLRPGSGRRESSSGGSGFPTHTRPGG